MSVYIRRTGLGAFLLVLLLLIVGCTRRVETSPETASPSSVSVTESPLTQTVEVQAQEVPTETPFGVYMPSVPVAGTPAAEEKIEAEGTPSYQLYAPFVPGPAAVPGNQTVNDPHIEIQVTPVELGIGDQAQITCQAIGIGLPYYSLVARRVGENEPFEVMRIQYDGVQSAPETPFPYLEVTRATADLQTCAFTLRALSPAELEVWISATGEIQTSDPPSASWGGGSSSPVLVTIRQ